MEITQEQIQDLIHQTVSSLKDDILAIVDIKNQGLAASVKNSLKKSLESLQNNQNSQEDNQNSEESSGRLTVKAAMDRIAALEKQLAEKEKQALLASRNQAVSEVIASSNAINKSALQKLFLLDYGESLKQEGNQWFVDKGDEVKPLSQALTDYLSTSDGEGFLPPSGVNGSGSEESKPTTPNQKELTLDERWAALYNHATS